MHMNQWTKRSGLRVLHVPLPNADTVTVLVLCKTGSKYETDNIAGISHFLEHMFFKGTKKRPTARAVSETLDAVGGEFNAFTGKEYTGYYAKVADRHAEVAMDVIGDILTHSVMDAREINRERGVIIEEMRMYQDSPMRYVPDLLEAQLYGDQSSGRLIIGTEETIQSMKRKDFMQYLADQYVSQNMALVVVGNVTKAKVASWASSYFADLPSGKAAIDMDSTVEEQEDPGLLLHYKETDQAHVALAFRGVAQLDPARPAHVVLAAILGGGMSSRLFTTVRERMGLAYYVNSSASAMTDLGYLEIRAGVQVNKLQDAIIAMLQECEALRDELVTKKELTKAKEYVKGKFAMGLETSDDIAFYVGEQLILHNAIETREEKMAKIEAVTAAQVRAAARDLFQNHKLNAAIIGPYRDPVPVLHVLELEEK